ncbi:oxygenase MpaB family protein [Kutzneria viridogrisea]|uniref:ER-bound oxygenase mpaB/mpaB'/Rubber oxygenase catalytic domain-containing protein n=1 Tax=Kutzneria viridogrisea TaxID=47990 RepID=A0ABR6BME8_9PSEU|nr:hypothetical protein [Kutzneria viridogrisea]
MDRWHWLRRILSLDPERDHQEIYRISAGFEFPWDYQRALEFALYKTYCVPSISALLVATGEFEHRPQKRYDDTALLMAELAEHGYDSPRGKESLRVVNRMHGQYRISNEDMLYVLSTFIYEPIGWLHRYGWRRLTEHERLAAFHFYREVGRRMGIQDIPSGYAEFRRWARDFERDTFRFTEDNRRIGIYTLDLMCSWYPAPLRPAVRRAVTALLEPRMITAFGFTPEPARVTALARAGLRARSEFVRLLPPRRASRMANEPRNPSYPGYPTGYTPADLGAGGPPQGIDPAWLRESRSVERESRSVERESR